jgi:hypothetical protein
MKDFFDAYSLKARIPPALLVVVFSYILYTSYYKIVLNISDSVEVVTFETLLSIGLLFVLSSFIRSISKYLVEEKMLGGVTKMPTTDVFLATENSKLSKQKIVEIYSAIKDDLNVDLLERQEIMKGQSDEIKKEIVAVIAKIRDRTRSDAFLLRANIEYGLWRNILGACIFMFLIIFVTLLIDCILFGGTNFFTLLWFIAFPIVLFIVAYWITKKNADSYADRLLEAYMLAVKED